MALFASSSGLSVANVYYAQPLLDALALSFSITPAAVGGVIFATQVGCTLALLLLVLLGAISALIAGRAGDWADSGLAERTSALALAVLLLSWLPLWLGAGSLILLIVGILLLDAAPGRRYMSPDRASFWPASRMPGDG